MSHLAAAIIGGGIVLVGGDAVRDLAQQAGIPLPAPQASVPEAFVKRVGDLESALSDASGAQTRVAALEQQSERVRGLETEIEKLKTAANEAPANGSATSETLNQLDSRLGEIEKVLSPLASASGDDNGSGARLAEVAALSGKLADLESALETQLAAVRDGLLQEIETRVAPAVAASTAARSTGERVDRELAELKTETARLAQRAETLKANQDRIDNSVRAASEETASLSSTINGLKGDLGKEIAKAARPEDVSAAVAPVSEKLAALEKGLGEVVSREAERQESASRIVLALQLANLKRALDRGSAYDQELAAVAALAGDRVDLGALKKFESSGVATVAKLLEDFRGLSFDIIRAGERREGGNWVDKLVSGAQSIVQVRRTGRAADIDPQSVEGVVATIEKQLEDGRVAAALGSTEQLPEASKAAAKPWLDQLEARATVDTAIAKIEGDLKDALTSGQAATGKG